MIISAFPIIEQSLPIIKEIKLNANEIQKLLKL
jgi:hypothetical protein